MRPKSRVLRRFVTALLWLLVAAAMVKELGRYGIRRQLGLVLGRRPVVRLRLLRLAAESPEGEGEYRGVRVAWKGIRLSGWGDVSVDSLEIGSAILPLAKLEGMSFSGAWTLARGRVRSLELAPLRPEWNRLASSTKAQGDWILRLPMNANVESLKVRTPSGDLRGSGWVWGEGRGEHGTWSVALLGPEGEVLEGSGSWNEHGGVGECQISMNNFGFLAARGSWTGSSGIVQTDLWAEKNHLVIDGSFERDGPCRILLCDVGGSARSQAIALGLNHGLGGIGGLGSIDFFQGHLEILRLPAGEKAVLAPIKLNVDSITNHGKQGTSIECISVSVDADVSGPRGSRIGAFQGNLHYRETADSALLLECAFQPGIGSTVQDHGLEARAAAWVEAPQNGPLRSAGVVQAGEYTVDFSACRRSGDWEGAGEFRGPWLGLKWSGLMKKTGDWVVKGSGSTRAATSAEDPFLLPASPAAISFAIQGRELSLYGAELEARDAGEMSVKLSGDEGSIVIRKGALRGAGVSVEGLDVDLVGEKLQLGGDFGEWHGTAAVKQAFVGSFQVAEASVRARAGEGRVEAEFRAGLPAWNGEGSGKLSYSPGGNRTLVLSSGVLRLMGEGIVLQGLNAKVDGAKVAEMPWTCERATAFGEELEKLAGTVFAPGAHAPFSLEAEAEHWGGRVAVRLAPSDERRPLRLSLKNADLSQLPRFLKRWVDLPLGFSQGKVDVELGAALPDPSVGLEFTAYLRDATLAAGDDKHTLRGAGGKMTGSLEKGDFQVRSEGFSFEKGAVPAEIAVGAASKETSVTIATPEVPLADLQNAFFDFLPEYLGYGRVEGKGEVRGEMRIGAKETTLDATLAFHSGGFTSEDKFLKAEGIDGAVPVLFHLGEARDAVRGFSALDAKQFQEAMARLEAHAQGAQPLSIQRVSYSVFAISDIRAETSVAEGNLLLRVMGAKLWGGELKAEALLSVSSDGLRYSGQALLDSLSLKELCDQAQPIRGFISGDVTGSLTFGGEGLGLSKLRALLDVWVDPNGRERREIARDFLVKMGGERIRMLLKSDVLPYDEASLRLGLDEGTLSFYGLTLRHEASPIKGLLRKDVSYEVRIPQRNTISIWQLINHIKALEQRSGPQ